MVCDICGKEKKVWGHCICVECYSSSRRQNQIQKLKQQLIEKDKELERLYQLLFNTREIISHILIVNKRPVKGTTKEDCYDALEKLQKLYTLQMYYKNWEDLDK